MTSSSQLRRAVLVLLVPLVLALPACSSSEPSEPGAAAKTSAPSQLDQWAAQAQAQADAMANEKPKSQACEIVTAKEVSAILGEEVSATVGDRFTNQTICTYAFANKQTVVNFQIDWGDAGAAAMGMGRMGQSGPAAAESSAGLGDGYTQFGPTMMIRVGEDLVTLQLMGVDDAHAVARRILQIAQARM